MLELYTGPWSIIQSSHLLRRATYGPTYSTIIDFGTKSMDECLDILLADIPALPPPVNISNDEDPEIAIGETWVNAKYGSQMIDNRRKRELDSATFLEWIHPTSIHIREKMVLFWHNHFVTADIKDARFKYQYINTLRTYALGDFRQLTKDITIDGSMLRYLNGDSNTKNAPNENYARELLELFTLGKGELAGPGDYTTYTEDDVRAIAKVLTGWKVFGYRNANMDSFGSIYRNGKHDQTTKQLSHRFDNIEIPNMGESEYAHLIDIIFSKNEVAEFLARNIYRWFVFYDITPAIEENIIQPLAQIIRDADYQVKPALKALLSSAHFYDDSIRGCMIKHPIEFLSGMLHQLEQPQQATALKDLRMGISVRNASALLQMEMFEPPSVAGWSAFYQSPSYYQLWLSSVTLPSRTNTGDTIIQNGVSNNIDNIDLLEFISHMSNPRVIDPLIDDIVTVIFPKGISINQKSTLKNVLLTGLPDFEWTVEYNLYLDNLDDAAARKAVEDRLKTLLTYMLRMPEYQLI